MFKCSITMLLVCVTSSVGCVSVVEPDEPTTDSVMFAAGGSNGLGWDSLATEDGPAPYNHPYGAAILEGTLRTALINNALNNLPNGVKDAVVNDGWSNELFKYVVECALPAWEQSSPTNNLITINNLSPFLGKYGLYPGWKTGACDTTCQEQMSACIIAHTNLEDAEESIGIVADWGPVENAAVYNAYTRPEAAYFGNIFLSTPRRHACYNGALSSTMGILRVCDSCTSSDCTCRDSTPDARVVLKGSGYLNMLQGCTRTCSSTNNYKIAGNNNSRYYDNCTVDGVTYTNVVTVRQP
jgi:hypothetical protein